MSEDNTQDESSSDTEIDYMTFGEAWDVQHTVGPSLDHDPKCSSVPGHHPLSGPALLCDCGAIEKEWKRRKSLPAEKQSTDLESFRADLQAKIDAMTDEELIKEFADRGCNVVINKPGYTTLDAVARNGCYAAVSRQM